MDFQNQVNTVPAPGIEGDFADHNPRASVIAGPGGFVAGSGGLVIGRFAWAASSPVDPDGSPTTVTNAGSGAPDGFVCRHQQGLITTYLSKAGMTIPQGFACTLMSSGAYWVKNDGSGANTRGQKAFASNTDGSVKFANAGATVAGYTETKFVAESVGAAGEIVKITSHVRG